MDLLVDPLKTYSSAVTSILNAALLILFVLATKLTRVANAIFLQYTAPMYVLILEPVFHKESFACAIWLPSQSASVACSCFLSASCGFRLFTSDGQSQNNLAGC